MENAIRQVGLPVVCVVADCPTTGFVKPHDYGGWYKCKMLRRTWRKRWFCPEHYQNGRDFDNKFYENYRTPDPYTEEEAKVKLSTEDELYKLLDD